jgi:hypothetical protein
MLPFLTLLLAAPALFAGTPRIQFEPNRGQSDSRVQFLARTPHGIVFFAGSGMVLSAPEGTSVKIELAGSNPDADWKPVEPTGGVISYHVGRDPERWADNIPRYGRLSRTGVYPGIDVSYYGTDRQIEYDFLLAPQADPGHIRLRVSGARRLSMNAEGELVISTDTGQIRHNKPVLYQIAADGSRQPVSGGFRLLRGEQAGFWVGRYDHSRPLAIDPTIDSASYLGGSGDDQVIYSNGAVVAGNTMSSDFPNGSVAPRKGWDVFYENAGFTQIFGGSGDDILTSFVSSPTSYPYPVLLGYTNSTDLPTSAGSIQPNYAGGPSDGFIIYVGTQNGQPLGWTVSYYGTAGEDRITASASSFNNFGFTGWTTGRGLRTGSTLTGFSQPTPTQDGTGGGVDGFLVTCSAQGGTFAAIFFNAVRYFGGSGDDRPTSIAYSGFSASLGYYIAGETTSPDFPNLTGVSTAASGSSDAFIIHYDGTLANSGSLLYGGSGADRIAGIAVQAGSSVQIAGTTTSPDLPLLNPRQPAFGGGASDAFVATFAPDFSAMSYASYWGGSAADEATSVSPDPGGGLFVGGWTSSHDFPVNNAVQSTYGGGADDGFMLHFDSDGSLIESTFFGGSGSDRILSVNGGPGAFQATLGGQTNSPDLPVKVAQQTQLAGGMDGFTASITAQLIGTSHVTGSAGFRAYSNLNVPALSTAVNFTFTTSDPASVLVAATSTGAAAPSVTLTNAAATAVFTYYVDCLANGVSADITVSATGFPSKVAHVDCVKPSLSLNSFNPLRVSLWTSTLPTFSLYLLAVNPNNPNDGNSVFAKSDAGRISLQMQISDPAIASLSATNILVGSLIYNSTPSVTVTPLALGSADISFSSPQLQPRSSDTLHLTVLSPLAPAATPTLPGGFQTFYSVNLGRSPAGASTTFSSGDPTALLLSADPTVAGTPSATVPASNRVYLQALVSSGQTTLTISVNGLDPVTVPVTFKAPVLNVTGLPPSSPTVLPNSTILVSTNFESFTPNPQTPVRLNLAASDPQILKVTQSFVDLTPQQGYASFQVQTLAQGTATLTLTSSNGTAPPPGVSPATITVADRGIQLHDLTLGKDLSAAMQVVFPVLAPPTAQVTISSSDPGKVMLGTGASTGQAQLTGDVSHLVNFNVFALAGSGTAKITAAVTGFGSATSTVTLVPSGIGWTTNSLNTDLYQAGSAPQIALYALDPGTMFPMANQAVRPGVNAIVQVQSDHPSVVTPTSGSVAISAGAFGTSVNLTNVGPGDATVTLTQPSGFSTPASRQSLSYHVLRSPLSIGFNSIGINTQQSVQFNRSIPPQFQKMATLTSSDPSKLVFSTDPAVLGSGIATVNSGAPFYAQALDSNGPVSVTASMDGFADTVSQAYLSGSTVVLSVQSTQNPFGGNGSIIKDGDAYTTLLSGNTSINLNLATVDPATGNNSSFTNASLRPGIDPRIAVQSSNPAAGTIPNSPASFQSSSASSILQASSASVNFQPAALGNTQVTAVSPPGFTPSSPINFHVTLPAWDIGHPGPIGKDTALPFNVNLGANVGALSANLAVTISSGDPARMLVSKDATTPGSASVTMTLVAGQRSPGAVFVQALDNQGSVPLIVTAPGFADSNFSIPLTDTLFGVQVAQRVVVQEGAVNGTIVLGTATQTGGYSIRPGASITMHIDSTDASVLAVDTPNVTIAAGATSGSFKVHGVGPGQATLTLTPQSGYGTFPASNYSASGTANVTVDLVKLVIDGIGLTIGKDLQGGISIGTEPLQQPVSAMVFTVTSSDPSRLLVSINSTAPGAAQAIFTSGVVSTVYLQALADSGTVTISLSAPGAQPASTSVQLGPSAVVFTNSNSNLTLSANGSAQSLSVQLLPLNPSTYQPYCCVDPRPGWSGSVSVTSSDPKIASVAPASLQLVAGSGAQSVTIKPGVAGTAIVSLGLLPGGDTPASGGQIVVNVR